MVDAIGQLIQGRLTEGQVHDVTQAPALLSSIAAKCVVADKAYDAQATSSRSCDSNPIFFLQSSCSGTKPPSRMF